MNDFSCVVEKNVADPALFFEERFSHIRQRDLDARI